MDDSSEFNSQIDSESDSSNSSIIDSDSDSSEAEFVVQRAMSSGCWRRLTDRLRFFSERDVRSVKLLETDLVDDERLERLLASLGKVSSFSMHLGRQAALLLSTLTKALPQQKFTRLALKGCGQFTLENANALSKFAAVLPLSSLTHLKLQSQILNADNMKALVDGLRGSKVTSLSFHGSRISTKKIEILAKSLPDMKLSELDISATGMKNKGVAAVASVLRDTSIEKLDISNYHVGLTGIAAILEGVRDTAVTTLK
jgi:hypothetical protein